MSNIERYLSQSDVLPHCTALVSNDGAGSTLGTLAAGAPLVIVPNSSPSQIRNAHPVAASGTGRSLPRRALDPPRTTNPIESTFAT